MSIDKEEMIANMSSSLFDVGISQNTADVLTQQYSSLISVDKNWASRFAEEVESRITGAYQRILAQYKEKMSEEEFEQNRDYLESVHIPTYVERNAQDIISSFQEIFKDDVTNNIDYSQYEEFSGNIAMSTLSGEYSSRNSKFNLQDRIDSAIGDFENSTVEKVNQQFEQNSQFEKQTEKKQGFFSKIRARAKSGISKITGKIKRFFGRG